MKSKYYLIIAVVLICGVFITFCSKKSDLIQNQPATSAPLLKIDSTDYYDSLIVHSENYGKLIDMSKEIILAMVESNLSFSEFKQLILAHEYDSIMTLIGFSEAEIKHFDTTFSHYNHLLAYEFGVVPSSVSCGFCNMTDEERCEAIGGIFNSNFSTSYVDDWVQNSLSYQPGGGGCHYVSYIFCCAGCISLLGEIPILCCLCIWACACEYCPSPLDHCEYLSID